MTMLTSVDELCVVKNYYYIGNFQHCINEAIKLKPFSAEVELQRKLFLYRSYIAQKKFSVIFAEIPSNISSLEFQLIRLYAEYLSQSKPKDVILATLESILVQSFQNSIIPLIAAHIYTHEEDCNKALKVLHLCDDLECSALMIQNYLMINRLDLAKSELKKMLEKDEDATLTQLCQAWLHLYCGGDKLQDAFYIFQEISDKYGSTPLLLANQAASLIGQQKYEKADAVLQDCLEKDPNDSSALLNCVVLNYLSSNYSENAERYFNQLKDSRINHSFLSEYYLKEKEFNQLCEQYENLLC